MDISVKAIDIRKGERHQPCSCMVALAIKRVIKAPYTSISVGTKSVTLIQGYSNVHRLNLPAIVQRNIQIWDSGKSVSPFKFALSIPENLLK